MRRQRSPSKVKDFILCLDISADTFRTKIATGNMFTSLCFFRQGTPNYVYIDLKRSPSILTLGQCKFDLRSMSKTSKLCQVVYHSTCLDETKVFKLLCGHSRSKDKYHKQNQCSVWKMYLYYIAKSWWRHFLLAIFEVLCIVQENY